MNNEMILFKCLVGSYLYGTNGQNSDKDFKGIFLPKLTDLILCKAPKHYTFSTGSNNEKNSNEDIDETYYSLQYFLELAAKGDTNAIDILFAYTNKNAIIQTSPNWNILIKNIDKILTKNVKAYLGYCKSQAQKYSIKGEKLNNFKKFRDFCFRHLYDIDKNGSPILLYKAFENQLGNEFKIPIYEEGKVKFNKIDFGDHCYLMTEKNNEYLIIISEIKIQLETSVKEAYHKINNVILSYGKRAEAAANDNGVDWKAISHCVRVLLQVEQLLTENKITFPLKEAEFVKFIKYNTSNMSYNDIMKWIEDKINLIDNELLQKSTLREQADYKWIEKFILKCYNLK